MSVKLTMTVAPEGGGARLTQNIEARMLPGLRPLGWLLDQIMRRPAARDMRRSVRQAKRIVEQEYGAKGRRQEETLHAGQAPAPSP